MVPRLNVLATSQDWLNRILTTSLIELAGRATHEEWLQTKVAALQDPNNPYRGYGTHRVKVRDLSPAQRDEYGIAPDAAEDADVFHPLHRPYTELDIDARSKNAVPMVVLCNALGDFVLPMDSELAELEHTLEEFLARADPELTLFLRKMQHLAYMSSQTRTGVRAYGDAPASDFLLYDSLSPDIQDLDETTLLPVAETLLARLRDPRQLAWDVGALHGERLRNGVTAVELATIMEYPDFTALEAKGMSDNTTEPAFMAELRELLMKIDGVDEVRYAGEVHGVDLVTPVVQQRDARIAGQIGRAFMAFKTLHPRLLLQPGDFIVSSGGASG